MWIDNKGSASGKLFFIVRQVLMFLILLIVSMTLVSLVSCTKYVVREQPVYKAEVDFVTAASAEAVEHGKALVSAECTCRDGVWTTSECADMGETIVVLESRMAYHAAFMLYLGGLTDKRPAEEPPEIPDSTSLCPVAVPDIPVRDGGVK